MYTNTNFAAIELYVSYDMCGVLLKSIDFNQMRKE